MTMTVDTNLLKELRSLSGAGILDCKKALRENNNDVKQAADWLRQKGIAKAAKKSARETSQGLVGSYIHSGRIGVLVEVNCETDFVAATDEFKQLVEDLAMHIAAMNPTFVSREEVSQDILDGELIAYKAAAIEEGKPENVADKIAQGKVDKYFQEQCLMEQSFFKDTDITIQDYITNLIATIGENIRVKRFARFDLSEK